jgi:hypothetical protein
MRLDEFFDLRVATVEPGEAAPPEADWVRVEEPGRADVGRLVPAGWFYKPCYVTYVLRTPSSLEEYIAASFRAGTRNKPRKVLREVPARYRYEVDPGVRRLEEFRALYRRTIVARERGRDRVSEHDEGFGEGWTGLHLFAGDRLAAGILVHAVRDHHSVGYGAFDPAHRELDLEHFLIMKAIERCAEARAAFLSLGMDTNRYGHHLPLGLPAYKLRIGFTPLPCEPAGRELVRVQRFDRFEAGLFFYSFEGRALVGNLFTRGEPDLRPFRHHTAPPVRVHRIPAGGV